jgi:hypothetical protein
LKPASAKTSRPYLKTNKAKRASGIVQGVECLPSKYKVLSSNSSTAKKKKEISFPGLKKLIKSQSKKWYHL